MTETLFRPVRDAMIKYVVTSDDIKKSCRDVRHDVTT